MPGVRGADKGPKATSRDIGKTRGREAEAAGRGFKGSLTMTAQRAGWRSRKPTIVYEPIIR